MVDTHKQASSTKKGASAQPDRAYSQELDSDFYGTNFEIYRVSKRTKRKGGSGGSEWCGGLQLSVRQSNWIQKNIFQANGSAGKFGPETVVYLASRDGFKNSVFHKKADLKGATLTLVYLGNGRIFGGFASRPWTSGLQGKYYPDPSAYLFLLTDGYKDKAETFIPSMIRQSTTSPDDAVFHDADLGPCFGRALGLQLDIPAYSSSDLCDGVKYRLPRNADGKTYLAGSYNGWDIQEVAVYQV